MEMAFVTKIWLNLFYLPFVGIMYYLNMDSEVFTIFSVLLVIDLVTGWFKTIALGNKPESWRLANGIISKIVLIIVPLVLALALKALHIDGEAIFYVAIDALILSEVYSILGNAYTIRTGKYAKEYDVLSKLLRLIRNTLNRLLRDEV